MTKQEKKCRKLLHDNCGISNTDFEFMRKMAEKYGKPNSWAHKEWKKHEGKPRKPLTSQMIKQFIAGCESLEEHND